MSSDLPSAPVRLDRRQALAWLATAAVGLTVAGRLAVGAAEPADRPHGRRIGSDPALNKTYVPGELWPLSFSPAQQAAAAALADLILPPEAGGKKPSELGVPAFVDEWISSYYDETLKDRPIILAGLTWLDAEANRRHGAAFAKLSEPRQAGIADDICGVKPVSKEHKSAHEFFKRFRHLVAGGYYTTPQGARELGYVGNTPSAHFDGPTPEALKHLGLA
jgi:Gluconate 2-dehydrogenase subunit 3